MATNLVQGDLTTLYVAASTSDGSTPDGAYNTVGTSTGEFAAGKLSSSFEKNVATIIARTEFLVASTENPATSATKAIEHRRQKKMLKDILAKAAMGVKPKANVLSDDRATMASRVTTKVIGAYNKQNRPAALVS